MKFIYSDISGLVIIVPEIFSDNRGVFFETFNANVFQEHGINVRFLQENQSISQKNVLRGLHFQQPPFAQGKLVRVICGSALDVAVDLRQNSPTFGKWQSFLLSKENKKMFWIPDGFAHGFLALEDDTIFQYLCTNTYHKQSEKSIVWNDPGLNINWGIQQPILSEKDAAAPSFKQVINNNDFSILS